MYAGRRTPGCTKVGRAYSSLTGYSRHCLKGAEVNDRHGNPNTCRNQPHDGYAIGYMADMPWAKGFPPVSGRFGLGAFVWREATSAIGDMTHEGPTG
jgi:hypothetical protein